MKLFSHVHLFATLWTVACQAPPSMGFSRQEYWSGLPLKSNDTDQISFEINVKAIESTENSVKCTQKHHMFICAQSLSHV